MRILGVNIPQIWNMTPKRSEPAAMIGSSKQFTIISQPITRRTVDMADYKAALSKAESAFNPLRYTLYDLYNECIDYDSQLSNAMDLRREAVKSKKFIYVDKDGKEIEDMTAWIASPQFKQFLVDVLDTRFYGFSLFDFSAYTGEWFGYDLVNRKHVDPIRQLVYVRQVGGEGISYVDPSRAKFVLAVGQKTDLGVLKSVIPDAIIKRNLKSDWANYAELAGNNFMVFKTKGNDPRLNSQASEIMKSIGSTGSIQLPEGMVDMEVSNLSSSQQNALFEGFYNALNTAIISRILGSNMTVEAGSSRAQADVHQNTTEGIHESDLRYVLDVLNYGLADYLPLWNLSAEGSFSVASESLLEPLAVTLGVGGTQALQSIITDQNLTPEQKKQILIILFSFGEDDAELMTKTDETTKPKPNDPTENQQD